MSAKGPVSRRDILKAGAGTAALAATGALLPHPVRAAADMQTTQMPGYYRFKLGEFEITILSDGAYGLPTDLLGQNQPREVIQDYLKAHFLDPDTRTSHVNIPLINTGEELILVDVGGGHNFQQGAGQLVANMQAAGYEPDDVDKIIITHGHPDHIWGLIDDFDELIYPNAEYYISENEWNFWTTDEAKNKLPEMFQAFTAGADRRLPMIADNTKCIKPGTEIASGIMTIDTPGHTAGHMSLQITSGSESLIVTADTLTHPFISFEHPDWWPRTDLLADQAEKSRRTVLEMAATDRTQMLVYHLTFPGLGNVARDGNAYRWIPSTWKWQL